jgi:hypothetical protein
MSKWQNLMSTGWLAVVAAGAAACATEATEPRRPEPIATLRLGNGVEGAFYEPSAGGLMAVIKSGVDTEIDARIDGLAPLAIYERLAGSPAPAALRDAQARADQAFAARRRGDLASAALVTAPGSLGPALTASHFASAWCTPTGNVDFDHCLTNRVGNLEFRVANASWIHAHANAFTGQVTLSMIRTGFFGDTVVETDTVQGSATVVTQDPPNEDGLNDTWRVTITEAGELGDAYHLSIHGGN